MFKHLTGLAMVLVLANLAPAFDVVYETGFESGEGYSLGSAVSASADWDATANSEVPAQEPIIIDSSTSAPFEGSQAVQLPAATSISTVDGLVDSTEEIVWVQGYFKGAGSSATPDFSGLSTASAIVFFGDSEIQAYDGDLAGGGTWSGTGISLSASAWTNILLKLDFNAQEYDVFIASNGADVGLTPALSGLGFRDNITQLSGFQALASEVSYFDAFKVVNWVAYDANGDSKADIGDVVTMVNETNGSVITSPILFTNADAANSDGVIDNADITALVNQLSGI